MTLFKTWRFLLGCTISLLCLWFAFRNVPLGELVRVLAGANFLLLLAAIVSQLLAVVTRARRWLVLLDKEGKFADSFWAQSVGFLFTNVFPLRAGEPARVLVMADRCGLPVMQVTASAIVERLLDVATNVLVLILVLPWMQVPTLMNRIGVSFGVLVLMGLGILLLVVRFSDYSERLLQSVCTRLPLLPAEKVVVRWKELVSGFLPLTRWRTTLRAVGWSLVTWGFSVAMFWSVLCAFQPDGRLVEAAFMMVALAFAVAVPSSPGFVGVFQLIGQQALVLPFGAKYDAATALAITLTAHLTYYVLTTTLGIVGLWRLGESLMNLGRVIAVRQPARKAPLGEVVP
ncbi:MAG: lysylphosphatidylglycerol synthase transmembrane domain-containing protein [Candidatus Methylomirabilales bacterium]